MRTKPPTVITLVIGLTLLVGTPGALGISDPAGFGDPPAPDPSAPSVTLPEAVEVRSSSPASAPGADAEERAASTASSTSSRSPAEISVGSARLSDLPAGVSAPDAVRLDRLGIAAPIDPVGMSGRVMDVPDDVDRAGWFEPGVAPGSEQGSAVLSAHVDSRAQGEGAFFPLRHAQRGDRIEVDTREGSTVTFEVTTRVQYDKSELPSADLFRREGPHQLVLITCGGKFDSQTGSYDDNVVVVALPLER